MSDIPGQTHIHLPPPYRRSRGDWSVLLFITVVIGLGTWRLGHLLASPEPLLLMAPTVAIPLSSTKTVPGATQVPVVAVAVTNWPTVAPAPTSRPYHTPTPAFPSCPAKDGAICQVTAPVIVVTPEPMLVCSAETLARFTPGQVCRWSEPTPTPAGMELWS